MFQTIRCQVAGQDDFAVGCARPLSFPVAFPDVPAFLLHCKLSRQVAAERLGPPMLTAWVDGLGDADFWAFEFPCGLQVAFEFVHHSSGGRVIADSPEVNHVLRHIPFAADECQRLDNDGLGIELQRLLKAWPDRRPEIEALHAFQVWRQGNDGNPFKVGEPTSEPDAKCWVQHLESSGHKQLYWYSPAGGANDLG